MKISTRAITLAATLAALCAVTGFIPYVFFLPVVVAATTLSIGMTAFVGMAFGFISWAYSVMMPRSPVAMAFIEAPYIAILPRILAAVAAFGVALLVRKLFKPTTRGGKFAAASVSAAFASLFNTAFVVGLMVLAVPDAGLGGVTVMAYVPTMLISGAIECPCMALLVPPITLTLQKTVLRDNTRAKLVNGATAGAGVATGVTASASSADGDKTGSAHADVMNKSGDKAGGKLV